MMRWDGTFRPGGIDEANVGQLDVAFEIRSETPLVKTIDTWDPTNRLNDFFRSREGADESVDPGRKLGDLERADHDGKEDIDDETDV
jgi:hypothetical protein